MKFNRPISRYRFAITTGFVAGIGILAAGCGGGKSGPAASPAGNTGGTGRAVLSVVWPSLTRHIPWAADRIKVTVFATDPATQTESCLFGDADAVCTNPQGPVFVLDRPQLVANSNSVPGTSEKLVMTGLPVRRKLRFVINALAADPNVSGQYDGTSVASAEVTKTIDGPGTEVSLPVTLDSTISSLEVTDAEGNPVRQITVHPTVPASSTDTELTVSAKNSSGETVLLRRSDSLANTQITWTLPGGVATPSDTGQGNRTFNGTVITVRRAGKYGDQSADVLSPGVYPITVSYDNTPTSSGATDTKPTATVNFVVAGQNESPKPESPIRTINGTLVATPTQVDVTVVNGAPLVMARQNELAAYYTSTIPGGDPAYFYTAASPVRITSAPNSGLVSTPDSLFALQEPGANPLSVRPTVTIFNGLVFRPAEPVSFPVAGFNDVDAPAGTTGLLYGLGTDGSIYSLTRDDTTASATQKLPAQAGAYRLATVTGTGGATFYRAKSDTVYKGQDVFVSAASFPSGADSALSNPDNESLGTIEDIAADASFLYVIAEQTNGAQRLHVFNTTPDVNGSAGKWLYSVPLPDSMLTPAIAVQPGSGNQATTIYGVTSANNVVRLFKFSDQEQLATRQRKTAMITGKGSSR